jgi:hypothetical protein
MPKRKSMIATGPKGIDAYFPEKDKDQQLNSSAKNNNSVADEPGEDESFKTTAYITTDQRDYIDGLRYRLRKKLPGLTRSAVIRLALNKLADLDEEQVVADLMGHTEGEAAQ